MQKIINEGFSLNRLGIGETALVRELEITGGMRRRLLDIGLVEGTRVKCLLQSPAGDPKAYLIRGAVIALRSEDTEKIIMGV